MEVIFPIETAVKLYSNTYKHFKMNLCQFFFFYAVFYQHWLCKIISFHHTVPILGLEIINLRLLTHHPLKQEGFTHIKLRNIKRYYFFPHWVKTSFYIFSFLHLHGFPYEGWDRSRTFICFVSLIMLAHSLVHLKMLFYCKTITKR